MTKQKLFKTINHYCYRFLILQIVALMTVWWLLFVAFTYNWESFDMIYNIGMTNGLIMIVTLIVSIITNPKE